MPIELTILTPEGEAYRGLVVGVVLPGSEGDFGVRPGHERFISPLRIGAIWIQSDVETLWYATSGGFARVTDGAVSVLVESCEPADAIDIDRAQRARERAELGLREIAATGPKEEEEEEEEDEDEESRKARIDRLEAALYRALNRLRIGERQGL